MNKKRVTRHKIPQCHGELSDGVIHNELPDNLTELGAITALTQDIKHYASSAPSMDTEDKKVLYIYHTAI